MVANAEFGALAAEHPEFAERCGPPPVPMVEPEDISNAIVYLCSEAGRYVTGATMPVDAGAANY